MIRKMILSLLTFGVTAPTLLADVPNGNDSGYGVSCVLDSDSFAVSAAQREAEIYLCFYGCQPTGRYGYTWYLTDVTRSNEHAPDVRISSPEGATTPGDLTAEVVVSFTASKSFYSENLANGADLVNAENAQLGRQLVRTSHRELLSGINRKVRVGQLGQDATVTYVDASLFCQAKARP